MSKLSFSERSIPRCHVQFENTKTVSVKIPHNLNFTKQFTGLFPLSTTTLLFLAARTT